MKNKVYAKEARNRLVSYLECNFDPHIFGLTDKQLEADSKVSTQAKVKWYFIPIFFNISSKEFLSVVKLR